MIEQGTPEWFAERAGKPTASCYADIMAKGTGRAKYMRQIVAERLTGKPKDAWRGNADIERGKAQEPHARAAYQILTGYWVEQVGFINHARLLTGCSPDGLVNDDGGTEIKSVIPEVQIETIESGAYPSEHVAQVQGSLWITGRKWWDFISYSPDLPENLQLYVYRVFPDAEYISRLSIEVSRFLNEADALHKKLLEINRGNT